MINNNEEKNTNKLCLHCIKVIIIDKSINNNKKFCNRECYVNFMKKKDEKPKIKTFWQRVQEALKSFKCFIFLLVLLRPITYAEKLLSPCILFKPLLVCNGIVYVDYWDDLYTSSDIFIVNNTISDFE